MKKLRTGKRLDNKGFTLIELLAVVVILAVVMGIAMTSVLSAMNKSRGGSLEDSALTIAQAFNQKYTESLVDGVPNKVYGGSAEEPLGASAGYNFQADAVYYLDKALANTFSISESGYAFVNSDSSVNKDASTGVTPTTALTADTTVNNSIVTFSASTGKFVVCMFANRDGSYYVDNYKEDAVTQIATIGSVKISAAVGTMYACSDGTKSW